MPPTFAAARNIACGRLFPTHSSTAFCLVKSSSSRDAVKTVQSSSRRRRRIAPPTMPRWPGTQTRFLLRSYIQPPCVEVTRHLSNDPQYQSRPWRSEEHTSELQSLMRISYAVFCLKKKKRNNNKRKPNNQQNT